MIFFFLFSELERIEAKYRKFHYNDSKDNKSNEHSELTNTFSVRKLLNAVQCQNRNTDVQSVVQSTIIPSEIDGGATRMKMGLRIGAPSIAPSGAQSTIVPSEINGGETQMQKKRGLKIAPPSDISNGQKSNRPNRNRATNYVNSNEKNVRRQMPPMPAGHEPDMDNFTKYNS